MNKLQPWFFVERSARNPIIVPHMDSRMGDNINGASLIEVPGWVTNPLGRYYLYFSHHEGRYIRLAYADEPEGPWQPYEPGALSLEDSTFPTRIDEDYDGAAEVPPNSDWATPHIASPDVHVDHANRQILMYFHGLARGIDHKQPTRVGVSADGLHFNVSDQDLGPAYMRVFHWRDAWYAWAMPGMFLRSPDGFAPFETDPTLDTVSSGEPIPLEQRRAANQRLIASLRFPAPSRHAGLFIEGSTLYVAFSMIGDCPERLKLTTVDLSPDWTDWRAGDVFELLQPEEEYEGADLPAEVARYGAIIGRRDNSLRDPCFFRRGDELYLLYSLAGEFGIGIAKMRYRTN